MSPRPFFFSRDFIRAFISSKALMKRLTSWTEVPLPLAMRLRREPFRMRGSLRSSGVMERTIASRRFMAFSSTLSPWGTPGRRPRISEKGPRRLRFCICLRKSSRESSLADLGASASSPAARTFSARLATSPMPRMRPARRSG
jgi:hypothetical protein